MASELVKAACKCHDDRYNQFCPQHGLNGYYARKDGAERAEPSRGAPDAAQTELDPLLLDPSTAPHFVIGEIRAIVTGSYWTPEQKVSRVHEVLAEYAAAKAICREREAHRG